MHSDTVKNNAELRNELKNEMHKCNMEVKIWVQWEINTMRKH